MNQKTYETYLPVFNGFYESIWQFPYDRLQEYIREDRKEKGLFSEIDFDDLKINESDYDEDVIKSFLSCYQEEMKDFIFKIEFQKIRYPKEYNFATDSADVKITVYPEKIKEFIYTNKELFSEFLKERYTSRAGFISHYENDFESWSTDTKDFTDFSIDGHRLGSILDFISDILKIDNYSIYEYAMEGIFEIDYVENYQDLINQQDGSLFDLFTSRGFSKELSDYFSNIFLNDRIKDYNFNDDVLKIYKEFQERKTNEN